MSQPKDREFCCDFAVIFFLNLQPMDKILPLRAFGDDDTFHLSRHVKRQCYTSK